MAKEGIDSFILDCHTNENISEIEALFGIKGFALIVRLWQKIYSEKGYYCEWLERSPLLFLSNWFGGNSGVELNLITEVVEAALRIGIFDAGLYEKYSILTSKGIQKRYFDVVKRRTELTVISEYLLVSVDNFKGYVNRNSISVSKNGKNACRNVTSKVKESKVKESKEEGEERTSAAADEIIGYYSSNIHPVSSSVEKDKLIALVETHGDAFVHKAIERAVVRNKRSLAYITGILNRWEANGYDEGISESHKSSRNQWQHSEDYERFMREREEHKRKLRQRGS